MALDFLKVLQEIRGTGAAEVEYTDGIFWELTIELHNGNPGIYGDILYMYNHYVTDKVDFDTKYADFIIKYADVVDKWADVVASAATVNAVMLGAKAGDPTTDNDGNPLIVGSTYFNTTLTPNHLRVWNGDIWDVGIYDNTTRVISFNGRSGVLTLSVADIEDTLGFTVNEYTVEEKTSVDISTVLDTTADTLPSSINEVHSELDAHKANTGEDHSFINQDVKTTASPTFVEPQVESIQLDLVPTAPIEQGMIQWNIDEKTVDIGMIEGVVQQVGQETYFYIKNQTGAILTNGTPIMFAGALGASGRLLGQKAIADGSLSSSYIMGIATHDILNGEEGYVTNFGKIRGIDTTGTPYGEVWADGDILYVSPTVAGAITNVKPSAPNLQIEISALISAQTNGTLFVRPTWAGRLVDLNDVNGTTPLQDYALLWDATNNYFDPKPITPTIIGLGNVDNTSDVDKPVSTDVQAALDLKFDKTGGVISSDVTVNGNLYVNGDEIIVSTSTVEAEDNLILINKGEVGAGVTAGSAGIEVDRGTATNYEFKFDESDDSFKVGEIGALQKVATREDSPTDNGVAIWDLATFKFTTTLNPVLTTVETTGDIIVGGTVDGRDVAVDGSKLDTVEDNAKDDQSAAEVPYTNTTSGLTATNVQTAIDEVDATQDNTTTRLDRDIPEPTFPQDEGLPLVAKSTGSVYEEILGLPDETDQTGKSVTNLGTKKSSFWSFVNMNPNIMDEDQTLPSGVSASVVDGFTINDGVTLTIPDGGVLSVV